MFFFNDKVNNFLQELYNYTDEEVAAMRYLYTDTISRLILDECLLYAEQNQLKEYDEIIKKLRSNGNNLEKQIDLLKQVYSLPSKYKELEKHLEQLLGQLDDEIIGDITKDMSENDAIEFLKLIKEDILRIEELTEKYLTDK